jgi:hypothetical protein
MGRVGGRVRRLRRWSARSARSARIAGLEFSRKGVVGAGALPEWREVLEAVKKRGHRGWERLLVGTGPAGA